MALSNQIKCTKQKGAAEGHQVVCVLSCHSLMLYPLHVRFHTMGKVQRFIEVITRRKNQCEPLERNLMKEEDIVRQRGPNHLNSAMFLYILITKLGKVFMHRDK